MIIKTSRRGLRRWKAVKRLHSYEIPEIIALSIEKGSRDIWLG